MRPALSLIGCTIFAPMSAITDSKRDFSRCCPLIMSSAKWPDWRRRDVHGKGLESHREKSLAPNTAYCACLTLLLLRHFAFASISTESQDRERDFRYDRWPQMARGFSRRRP